MKLFFFLVLAVLVLPTNVEANVPDAKKSKFEPFEVEIPKDGLVPITENFSGNHIVGNQIFFFAVIPARDKKGQIRVFTGRYNVKRPPGVLQIAVDKDFFLKEGDTFSIKNPLNRDKVVAKYKLIDIFEDSAIFQRINKQ
jgi:hypothetical protein